MLQVQLSNVGNPDFCQAPDRPLPGTGGTVWVQVRTLREAVKVCRDYIAAHELGGGNWTGGDVLDETTREVVARVSYNGRVWQPGTFPTPEITDLD